MSPVSPKYFYIAHHHLSSLKAAKTLRKKLSDLFPEAEVKLSEPQVKKYFTLSVLSDKALDADNLTSFEQWSRPLFSHHTQTPYKGLIRKMDSESPHYIFSVLAVHNYTEADRLSGKPKRLADVVGPEMALSGCHRGSIFNPHYSGIYLQSVDQINPLRIENILRYLRMVPNITVLTFTHNP